MSQSAALRLVESSSMDKDKLKALDAALSQIERNFGKGSIMKMGDDEAQVSVQAVPTGALSLDLALGRRDFVTERPFLPSGPGRSLLPPPPSDPAVPRKL